MGSVLHGCARTTPCVRAELQASQESTRSLAARYGLNPKTVAKWRKRTTTVDASMGPKVPKSTVLTPAEEAIVVAFRQKTLLPLDDLLGCLSCELRHADGKLVMFLAIDRVSKFTYVEFHDSAGKMEGAAFLRAMIEVFPYQIHTVLTDNGMAFADLPKNRQGPSRCFLGPHIFDRVWHR